MAKLASRARRYQAGNEELVRWTLNVRTAAHRIARSERPAASIRTVRAAASGTQRSIRMMGSFHSRRKMRVEIFFLSEMRPTSPWTESGRRASTPAGRRYKCRASASFSSTKIGRRKTFPIAAPIVDVAPPLPATGQDALRPYATGTRSTWKKAITARTTPRQLP